MNFRPIFFVGRSEAEDLTQQYAFPSVISISDPSSPRPAVQGDNVLRLRFDDVTRSRKGYKTADADVIRRVVDHYTKAGEGPTLVHCEAGISRSAAITAIGYYLLTGDETRAMSEMSVSREFPMRRYVYPNKLLLRLADEQMGTHLVAAAEHMGFR